MRWLYVSLLLLSATFAQVIFPDDDVPHNSTTPSTVLFPDDDVPQDSTAPSVGETSDQDGDQDIDDQLNITLNISNRHFNVPSGSSSSSSCFTPTNERGICGPLSQCQHYLSLVKHIRNPTVTQFFRERICKLLPRSIYLCCPIGSPILPAGLTESELQNSLIPSESVCGLPGSQRIINGTEVQLGAWPWLAAIGQINGQNQFRTFCGGSLITRRHVLTAAHCFVTENDLDRVRLGEHHLDHNDAGEKPKDFQFTILRSNAYNRITVENDIALLTLDRDVDYNDYIRPVCLPFNLRNSEFNGQSLTVVGWGATAEMSHVQTKVLMEANVPVVPRSNCLSAYNRDGATVIIDSRHLCAGVGDQDSCQGDSGGPLHHFDHGSGRYYIVGLVSFGKGCGRPDFPGVYTRVSRFLDWIQQNIQ